MNLSTGYPFALIHNGLPEVYPRLESHIKTAVAIIGGGISGALTAYYLIQAGIDCILVDGRTIGLGSTCASTSLLQYELDMPLHQLMDKVGESEAIHAYQLCSESIDTLDQISSKIKFDSFERKSSLYFAAHKKDLANLIKEFDARKKAGFPVHYLDEKEIKTEYGFKAPGAILSTQGAVTDAYALTHALLQSALKKGLKVYDRTYINKIKYQRQGVKLITQDNHHINARKVVNASGYEITEFIEKKIVKLHSTYAMVSEQLPSSINLWKDESLLWNTEDPYLYIRTTPDKRIMMGGRDEEYYNPTRRDKLIKTKTALLKKDFSKLFPGIPFIPEFSWTGTFGSTKDALPYIGTYSKIPHTYYALGFGGNGITFSVIAAQMIRDMLLGKKNKEASLFSFDR